MSFYIAAPAHKSQAVAYCNRAFTAVLALLAAGSVAQVLGQANEARKPSHQELVKAERYDIDVSFQPEKAFLQARAAITLRALPRTPPEKNSVLEAIEFELNPHLTILEVTDAHSRKL